MWIKSDHSRWQAARPRSRNCRINYLLMAKMDAVKITDGGNHISPRQRCIANRPSNNFKLMVQIFAHEAALYRA
jgi:hypothetical protein